MIEIILFFALSYSTKDPYPRISSFAECPTDDRGYEHIEKELNSYSYKNYYACNKNFKKTVQTSENLLLLYFCNFTNMLTNAVVITALQTAPLESIEIKNCNFYNVRGESIHLEVQKNERVVNIFECRFEKCRYFTNTVATAIYFKVTSGNIEKCTFMNNKNNPGTTHDIYYENYNDNEGAGTVKFNENNFIRKAYQDPCGNFISFKSNSAFEFTNNIVSISPNSDALLFTWPSDLASTDKLKFENNKMFPYNEKAIVNGGDFLKDKFTEITHDCPPNSVQQGVDVHNLCDLPFDFGSNSIEIIVSFVNIFHCTFYSNTNSGSNLGGAIYVSIGEDFPSNDEPVRIYNSDFVACNAVHGSAIYIDCNQSSLVFDFVDCYFHSNMYITSLDNYNDKKGGAIYISTKFTSFQFTSCSFDLNIAGDGGAIHYYSDTTDSSKDTSNNDSKYSLYLTDCKFNSNQGKSYGGGLYISLIGQEHSKPIELESCIFFQNTVIEDDKTEVELPEKGGAIYYSHSCSQHIDSTITENDYAFRVINCNFRSNIATYNGGAISISIENEEPSQSIEICKCSFRGNSVTNYDDDYQYVAGSGADIDFVFECSSTSSNQLSTKILDINECDFNDGKALLQGGAISVAIQKGEPKKSIEINNCSFGKGNAQVGGAINYRFTASSSLTPSKTLLDDSNAYALYVVNCTFESNQASFNGGAIAILNSNGESSNPIEISDCIFLHNFANETDPDAEYGGAIFYLYQLTQQSPSKTLLETTNNYCFGIHNCKFSENEISYFGGAVFIGFTNVEPSKSVEISGCSFDKNIASLGVGTDIYFDLDPKTYKADIKNEFLLNINDCNFTESTAKEQYGSIYVEIESGESSRTVEFNNCVFDPINTDGVYLISKNPSIYFHLNDCDFIGSAYSYFDIASAKFENCHFNDMNDKPIYYDSSSETFSQDHEFRIEKCTFNQKAEIESLVYFASKISSKFSFISNNIIILNNKTRVLGCSSDVTLDENGWDFQKNIINGKDELIKTSASQIIPASCQNGFICLPDCSGQARCDFNATTTIDEPKVELLNLDFNGLSYPDNGAAIHIYNYHVYCHESNFTSCTSENGGGGAIYIYIDTILESPIILEKLNFEKCTAIYGGAVFLFSDIEENTFKILNCTFIENSANKKPSTNGDVYYGGSALFMTVKKNEIQFCSFKKNKGIGVKIYNDFEKLKKIKMSKSDTFVLIEDCIFEADENSESSLFYLRGVNNEIPVEVKSCQFVGHLKDKSYHIDGKSLSDRKDAMKLKIESCEFSEGMESSINTKSTGLILNSIENKGQQIKDSNQKEKIISIRLISFVTLALVCFIVIFAFIIHLNKKEEQETNKEQEKIDL